MEALRGIVEDIWHYETAFRGQVPPLPHTRALPFPPASLPAHMCKKSPVFAGSVFRRLTAPLPAGMDRLGQGSRRGTMLPVSL